MLEEARTQAPGRELRPGRRARASVRGRHVRTRLHGALLRPPRGRGPRALPGRGAPASARARRRRLRAARGRRPGRAAGADPERRVALGGLQALLRAAGARRGARRRRDGLRRALVRRRPLLTRRRGRYRSIASLQRDNRVCRACVEAGFPLESPPVVQPYEGQRAYVFGQAPGVVEGQERRPWRGRAGQTCDAGSSSTRSSSTRPSTAPRSRAAIREEIRSAATGSPPGRNRSSAPSGVSRSFA